MDWSRTTGASKAATGPCGASSAPDRPPGSAEVTTSSATSSVSPPALPSTSPPIAAGCSFSGGPWQCWASWKPLDHASASTRHGRYLLARTLTEPTFIGAHFLPHLGRDNVYRILKAEGLSRRPVRAAPETPAGKFKEYELGFVHVDVKPLPKLRTADGELRKRSLFVAIDRRSRSVHLAVKDEETEAAAKAFLEEAVAAFPFRVTRLLTDRGSCFTAEGFERRCRDLGIEHRKSKPYTPRTNGMVERFNGRVQREVLGITVAGHRDLERLLAGFNQAYNARRQRVLNGRSPEEVVRERLARDDSLANPDHRPPSDLCALPRALLVVERANEVSQPDK